MKRLVYILPVLGFAVLAFFMFRGLLQPRTDYVPSVLIDKPAPLITAAAVDGQTQGFTSADLKAGHVTVVNFFASWCVPCHEEHPQLLALSKMPGMTLYGVDYEEHQAGAGRAFLDEQGNPFSRLVADPDGKEGIDWGVFLVPETYVVDGKGIVRFKLMGPLTPENLAGQLLPAIARAKMAS